MNASMSSRRVYTPALQATAPGSMVVSSVAFVVGLVLLVVAARTGSPFAAIPGFVGVAAPILYWNTMFWAWVWKDKKVDSNQYQSWY